MLPFTRDYARLSCFARLHVSRGTLFKARFQVLGRRDEVRVAGRSPRLTERASLLPTRVRVIPSLVVQSLPYIGIPRDMVGLAVVTHRLTMIRAPVQRQAGRKIARTP
jgi:hypothetical protein